MAAFKHQDRKVELDLINATMSSQLERIHDTVHTSVSELSSAAKAIDRIATQLSNLASTLDVGSVEERGMSGAASLAAAVCDQLATYLHGIKCLEGLPRKWSPVTLPEQTADVEVYTSLIMRVPSESIAHELAVNEYSWGYYFNHSHRRTVLVPKETVQQEHVAAQETLQRHSRRYNQQLFLLYSYTIPMSIDEWMQLLPTIRKVRQTTPNIIMLMVPNNNLLRVWEKHPDDLRVCVKYLLTKLHGLADVETPFDRPLSRSSSRNSINDGGESGCSSPKQRSPTASSPDEEQDLDLTVYNASFWLH